MATSDTKVASAHRLFAVARDESGTVRIVNDTTKRTLAALTKREAKQLSRELRRVLKSAK